MSDISPEEFAQMVAGASDKEIEERVRELGTRATLDRIFAGFEERFRPDRTEGVDARVVWKIATDEGEMPYTLTIRDGTCRATLEEADDAKATLRVKLVHFVKLVAGQADGMRLLLTRKLKVAGDLGFVQRMQTFFDQPKA